jgi:amino acid transporter
MTRTKDVETVLHQNDDSEGSEHSQLSKSLKARDLMGFGIGIVIGTGIFVLTGVEAKEHAGPAITVSFAIAGVVAMLAALCYAELAAAVPTAGSSYTYANTTIGEVFAWIIGWDLVLEFALGAVVTCVLLMVSVATETWIRFVAWFLVGMLVYFFYGRTHARLAPGVEELEDEIGGADAR